MTKSVPLDLWSLATIGTQEAERNEMYFNCWGAARLRTLMSAKIVQNFD